MFLLSEKITPRGAAREATQVTSTYMTQMWLSEPNTGRDAKLLHESPQGRLESEGLASSSSILRYFKHHDFTLVCSEAADGPHQLLVLREDKETQIRSSIFLLPPVRAS